MADVTDAEFETAVVERSKTVPVVIDLWAPWCGPCQSLGPILEKVIGETKGLVELAKVDVDQNPSVSQAFQVQSIPAVYAMIDGQVVDGFMGGQPEEAVVEFVQRLLDIKSGKGAMPGAPEDGDAETDAADADEGMVSEPVPVEPTMSEPGAGAAPAAPAAPAVSAAEADAIEEELKTMLTQVKGDDEMREKFLAKLAELGPDDPRTNAYRRKLASALF